MSDVIAALSAVPNSCLLAWGWRRRVLACLAGACAALALPPLNLLPLILFAFPCFVWLIDGALGDGNLSYWPRFRTGFSLGWFFGFGYFLAGLWWIGAAFLVDADQYAWAMPIAVLAMPMGLALFHGLAVGLAGLFWSRSIGRILVLASFLSASDWLRGHVLTGFPWNSFGYMVSGSLELSQLASVAGLYGLGLLVLVLACAPAVLSDGSAPRKRVIGAAFCAILLVLGFGIFRLHATPDPGVSSLDVRLVQPAIPQAEKWKPENRNKIFSDYLDLSSRPLQDGARVGTQRLIVWPESALPFLLTETPSAMVAISALLNGSNKQLVTGAIRAEEGAKSVRYYNSIFVLSDEGAITAAYDKVHLVPFGEYLPLSGLLDALGLSRLVQGPGAFDAGFSRRALSLENGMRFAPLICYEVIFPEKVQVPGERPDFMLNVTNDAWFGKTFGPYQHLAQARMRAIEQGVPLVRVANTGISAVIGPLGRTKVEIPLGEKSVADSPLPLPVSTTTYARLGDNTYAVFLLIFAIISVYCQYNPYSRKN